jgi:transcriptional regulator of acetoin/glycerol metabolism
VLCFGFMRRSTTLAGPSELGETRRLWSHDDFGARLQEECARSLRSGASFALVHVHGGATLVSDALDGALRAADVVGHDAPGELHVLLVDVSARDVGLVLERITTHLRERSVRATLGVACYPLDGRDPASLIAHATRHVRGERAPALSSKTMRIELDDLEKQRILDALERCAGNQTRAAQLVGISRRTLLKRLDDYGIVRPRKAKR